jgi:hypothetical protein
MMEITDVAVNLPIEDALFEYHPPAEAVAHGGRSASKVPVQSGPQAAPKTDAPNKADSAPLLDGAPTASGGCTRAGVDLKIEAWYALRIADNAVLMVWRRSAPEPAADGSRDRLSDIELTLFGLKGHTVPRHEWVYESESATGWNWSLIAAPLGEGSAVCDVALSAEANRDRVTLRLRALRFRDDELTEILTAARRSGLFGDVRPLSLSYLRARAQRLAESR